MNSLSFVELDNAPALRKQEQHGMTLTVEIVAMQEQQVRSRFVFSAKPRTISKGTI